MAREPRFTRIRPLGSGATGRVELARLEESFGDLPRGAQVAVKTLAPRLRTDPVALDALRSEAEAGQRTSHHALVRVLHHGLEDGAPYLLLSYVAGPTLLELIETDGRLPEPQVRRIGEELAGALAALHAAGLAHGDIKPENVRLDADGLAVLLDLGFARRALEGQEGGRGAEAGSLAYLSPERTRGAPPSPSADVFALGIVLYELATGVHPFGHAARPETRGPDALVHLGSSSGDLLRRTIEVPGADRLLAAIADARVVPPSHLVPTLTPFLDALLQDLLARQPEKRPEAAELEPVLAEGEASAWWRERLAGASGALDTEPRTGAHMTPVIGRERELEVFKAALEEAREGGAYVWLEGPAGSGKWRLVHEFAARARARSSPPLYLYARWTESAEARSAGSLLILLHRWLGLPPGARPGEREELRLRELVPPSAARSLLSALDPEYPTAADSSVPVALATWLSALAETRTVLVFLDDLDRAGPVTLGGISSALHALAGARVLLVLGARSDALAIQPERLARLHERVAARPHFFSVQLEPLDEGAMLTLVESLFHRTVPRRRLGQVLWRRSRGNPGLAFEIIHDLVTRGQAAPMSEQEPELVLLIEPDEIPLPRSLDLIIAERFRALETGDRMWLERLAVVGGRLAPEFLMRAFPPTGRAEIDAVLSRLVRLGWLVSVADRYRFGRPALREAVYRTLSGGRRRRLHLAAARAFAPEVGSEARAEPAFQRAFHLRAAEEHEELFDAALDLLHRLRRHMSAQRLLVLAQWAVEALDHLSADSERARHRLELLEAATDAADRLGRREEGRRLLDHMLDLEIDPEHQPSDATRLYLLHGRFAAGTGRFGLARGMLRNAAELAESSGYDELSSEALRRLSLVQGQIGEFEEARTLAERALELARNGNQLALAHLALAQLHILEDEVEPALAEVERALRELRRAPAGRQGVIAHAHMLRARIQRAAGRPLRALGAIHRAVRLARRAGERRLEAEARARLGGLLVDLDRADEAETHLRDAQLLANEIEDRRGQVLSGLWLGLLLWEGDDREARRSIEKAVERATDIGFYRAESVGLGILARVQHTEGELELADETSARAVVLLERHGAELGDRVCILGTRALVLRALGRETEARSVVRRLRRRVDRSVRRIRDTGLRRAQREYSRRLLEAVLSPEGPVYPRTPAPEGEPS